MKKEEFFKQLEYLLQDIPDEEREDALDYYRDYLAEAGSENEEQAIAEFGSPERVAAIIRADIAGNLKDGGSFTETGYEDERFRDPNYQVAKRMDLPDEKEAGENAGHRADPNGTFQSGGYQNGTYQNGAYQNGTYQSGTYQNGGYQNGTYQNGTYQNGAYQNGAYQNHAYQNGAPSGTGSGKRRFGAGRFGERYADRKAADSSYDERERKPGTSRLLKAVLWIILICVAFPFILGGGGILLGIGTGVIALIVGIVITVVVLTVVALVAGVAMIGCGVAFLLLRPFDSIFLFGIGIAGVGCGLIGVVIMYAAAAWLLPLIGRGIRKLIALITGKGTGKHE